MAYAQRVASALCVAKRSDKRCTAKGQLATAPCHQPRPPSSRRPHRRLAVVNDRRQNGTKDSVWHVDMDKTQDALQSACVCGIDCALQHFWQPSIYLRC